MAKYCAVNFNITKVYKTMLLKCEQVLNVIYPKNDYAEMALVTLNRLLWHKMA